MFKFLDPSHTTRILSGDEFFCDVDPLIRFENDQNDQLWVIFIHAL